MPELRTDIRGVCMPKKTVQGRLRSPDLKLYIRVQEDIYDQLLELRRRWVERSPDADPSICDVARRAIMLGVQRAMVEEAGFTALLQDEVLLEKLSRTV
jgi:hypothetical protein